VFSWLKEQGGLTAMAEMNERKAAKLYAAIDESPLYKNPVEKTSRSWMNIPFTLADDALDKEFLQEAKAAGLTNLKGHRVVGEGSSIYTTYVFRPGNNYDETLARWQQLKHAACQTIAENRGTISHQHGVGRDHAPYLPVEKGELGMAALRALSVHFDPDQRLAPGVLLEQ
jgi:alkyldihydroxyacetonephosphate synthase